MTNLRLYYPGFVDPGHEPETINFNSLDSLKADPAVKARMYGSGTELIPTYSYKDLEPEESRVCGNVRYYKHVFHRARTHEHWGAAVVFGETPEEVTNGLKLLGTVAIPPNEW